MPTLYLFADSNLFLLYKSIKQIDWSRLGNFDDIEVVVCRAVQRELAALKDGSPGRRSERARKAASTLLKVAQHGPEAQRAASPRVVLNLYGASQPKQELADQLDYSQNDDRIIGHLAQFIVDNCQWRRHVGPLGRSKTVPPGVFMSSEKPELTGQHKCPRHLFGEMPCSRVGQQRTGRKVLMRPILREARLKVGRQLPLCYA